MVRRQVPRYDGVWYILSLFPFFPFLLSLNNIGTVTVSSYCFFNMSFEFFNIAHKNCEKITEKVVIWCFFTLSLRLLPLTHIRLAMNSIRVHKRHKKKQEYNQSVDYSLVKLLHCDLTHKPRASENLRMIETKYVRCILLFHFSIKKNNSKNTIVFRLLNISPSDSFCIFDGLFYVWMEKRLKMGCFVHGSFFSLLVMYFSSNIYCEVSFWKFPSRMHHHSHWQHCANSLYK